VPEHACRIGQVSHRESPRFGARRRGRSHAKLIREVEGIEVFPPRLNIANEDVHHRIIGPFFDVEEKRASRG